MDGIVWWHVVLVLIILGAAYIQVYRGGIINFVRAKLGMPPKVDGPAVSRPKDGGGSDSMK